MKNRSTHAADEAAASLLRVAARVTRLGTGAGGRRDDGVHVIPIGCLGP